MGLFPNVLQDASAKGIDIAPKYIPREVFDKRAVEKNQVAFHDVSYIEVTPRLDGQKVAVELTDFNVFYSQDSVKQAEESLKDNASKIVVDNGQIFAMRFGLLGTEGGERRLNVLISRAKRRCDVFASITDEDIDTGRAKGKGVVAFKLFLHYARTGRLQLGRFASEDPSLSAMGDQIEHAIQVQGYQVHRHVGLSGLFIDIAVADPERPGQYVLGIELDGPSYASAQSARDRDRLRNAVLRDHGWQFHRVWVMDWLQRPAEETQKILHAIEEAREALRNEGLEKRTAAVPVVIVTIECGDMEALRLEPLLDTGNNFYVEAILTAVPAYQDLPLTSPTLLSKFVEMSWPLRARPSG